MADSFKKKYKLQGMVTSVILMWLDFVLIYQGLINGSSAVMATGMVVMLGATAVAYYFS